MLSTLICGFLLGNFDREWGKPEPFCQISNEAINESSGVVASSRSPGVFYTHNDSGDEARFFRFDRKGQVTGTFSLDGVKAFDWEDMAGAKIEGKSFLYFADVGDNARIRKSVFVHRVAEPIGESETIKKIETFELVYPDRARDCEALIVDHANGDLYLISKARDQVTNVYRASRPKSGQKITMEFLKTLEVKVLGLGGNLVTGADLSPDGKFIVLRTYSGALEYSVPTKFSDWIKGDPKLILLAVEKQGEAICYSLDGKSLLTTSEGSPCIVSRVPLVSR